MELFDDCIAQCLSLGQGPQARCWDYDPDLCAREGDPNELILKRDMAFELGEGSFPAVSVTAITQNETLVPRDRVALLGKDLPEIKKDGPFARITVLRTDDIYRHGDQAAYNLIKSLENQKFKIAPAGYMVRPAALSHREQVRVSKQAVKRGLTFQKVGNLLIQKYKENSHVQAVSVLFLTLPDGPYDQLERMAERTEAITKTLNHALLDVSMDCRACEWKPVCDAVEGMKELHQKRVEQKEEVT